MVQKEGLEDRIGVRLEDYRDLIGSFDRVVSIETLEAVDHRDSGPARTRRSPPA
jgi:cyclopropane-fatty-acyl-phospholipid synthase